MTQNKTDTKKKVFLRTYGCQMNERDSEFIAGLFLKRGYRLADSPDGADIILFNTCSVREHAEKRAISSMGQLMHKYEDKKIYAVAGCAAQALKEKLFKQLPKLNIVCGTGEIARLPELVKEAPGRRIAALDGIDAPLPESSLSYRTSKNHAYVSIMRGCDNFCSYCIVPYVRGRERSRREGDIINEIRDLVAGGITDITLLGQNVNSYKGIARNDGEGKTCNFVRLLTIINGVEGMEKIRFMTSHPKDANNELFKAVRELDKVVKHLHLPLQSGSDRILRLMNRGYTAEKYLGLAAGARKIVPGLRFTTDIITGFPTEKEKDFEDTLRMMKKIKFDFAYIFKYSPRPGTTAAKLEDDVPEDVKKRNHRALLDLQKEISRRKNEKNCRHSRV